MPDAPTPRGVVTPTSWRVIRGMVAANGTSAGGEGFTVARTPSGQANGDYTVTFTAAFSAAPMMIVSRYFPTGLTDLDTKVVGVLVTANGSCRVLTGSGGASQDVSFEFIAIGPA